MVEYCSGVEQIEDQWLTCVESTGESNYRTVEPHGSIKKMDSGRCTAGGPINMGNGHHDSHALMAYHCR